MDWLLICLEGEMLQRNQSVGSSSPSRSWQVCYFLWMRRETLRSRQWLHCRSEQFHGHSQVLYFLVISPPIFNKLTSVPITEFTLCLRKAVGHQRSCSFGNKSLNCERHIVWTTHTQNTYMWGICICVCSPWKHTDHVKTFLLKWS